MVEDQITPYSGNLLRILARAIRLGSQARRTLRYFGLPEGCQMHFVTVILKIWMINQHSLMTKGKFRSSKACVKAIDA